MDFGFPGPGFGFWVTDFGSWISCLGLGLQRAVKKRGKAEAGGLGPPPMRGCRCTLI